MRRREFITLVTAITWPLTVRAQQAEHIRLIGILNGLGPDDPEVKARTTVFEQTLQQLGWVVGRDLKIETQHEWEMGRVAQADRAQRHASLSAPRFIFCGRYRAIRGCSVNSARPWH